MQDKHEKLLKELAEQKKNFEDSESYLDVERDVLPLIVELEQTIKIEEQEIVLIQYRNELGKALKEIEFLNELVQRSKDEIERLINKEEE